MKVRLFGCAKFSWLASESWDRPLTDSERRFVERHRCVCKKCESTEVQSAMALNMLRESGLEPAEAPFFEERLIRKHRIQLVRASLQYWSPAVFAAGIAIVAVLAGMQMITESNKLPTFGGVGVDARRIDSDMPRFPELDLSRIIRNNNP
jgi:hypothetical protein